MRWLIVLAAICVAAVAIQVMVWQRQGRFRSSTVGQVASVALALAVLIAAACVARWFGILSLPIVVVAFVPVGLTARGLLIATRGARLRAAEVRAATAPPVTTRARLLGMAAWPVFLVLVGAVVFLSLAVATLVGPH